MTIVALDIQTDKVHLAEVRATEIRGHVVVAWLAGSELTAELDLTAPGTGWKIFPN